MQRTWAVRPHEGYVTVDRDECLEAIIDAFAHMWRSGGVVSMMGERVKAEDVIADGLPGEAFTSLFVIQWKDRTDARSAPEKTIPAPVEEVLYEAPEPASDATPDEDDPDVLVNVSDPSEATEAVTA